MTEAEHAAEILSLADFSYVCEDEDATEREIHTTIYSEVQVSLDD